jgi:hypothetical protein
MIHQPKAPKPTVINGSKKAREQKLEKDFERAALDTILSEQIHLTALDEKIARGMHALVDHAIKAASSEKTDTRLLRLIVRYSSARNRLLANIHRNPRSR